MKNRQMKTQKRRTNRRTKRRTNRRTKRRTRGGMDILPDDSIVRQDSIPRGSLINTY